MRIDELLEASEILVLKKHPQTVRTIQRAAERGVLVPILPGVFVRPEFADDLAARLLAVSAWSPGAVHGRTAVALLSGRAIPMPIELCSPNRAAPVRWLTVTRGSVPAGHRRRFRGISTVSAEYACLEVAVSDRGEAAFEFLRRRLVTPAGLAAALPAFDHTTGNAERRRIAGQAIRNPWSFAEAQLHDLLLRAGVDGWVANEPLRIGGVLLFPDMWFPAHRLIVEFDGEASHTGHEQFERDRWRQNTMVKGELRVLRFTWAMLTEQPYEVLETILHMLRLS